jgi:AcrR family transcriptional regulator
MTDPAVRPPHQNKSQNRNKGQNKSQNLRADARRNRTAIGQAAVDRLGRDPDTSVGDIALAAGVGRVTLYGHFPTRADLVEAACLHAIEYGETVLSELDLSGDPEPALGRLVDAAWQLVARSRNLLAAAEKTLPPELSHQLHANPEKRVRALLTRGRKEGVFRTDLPVSWLVTVMHSVMHGAAEAVVDERLKAKDAGRYITATLIGAYRPEGRPDERPAERL